MPEPKPKKQPDALAKISRVHQVTQWILSGASQHDITEAIAANFPGAQAEPLIVAAMTDLAKAGEAEPALVRGWCIEATREIYRRALEVGDLQIALRAAKQLYELAEAA